MNFKYEEYKKEGKRKITLFDIPEFDADKIFDCGQCFRFDRSGSAAVSGVWRDCLLKIEKMPDGSYEITGMRERNANELFSFLALDVDYGAIRKDIAERSHGSILDTAMQTGSGIRILRQDAWETVCSFIISQNNNIPRIKKIIAAMSERYGKKHKSDEGKIYFSFPEPRALLDAGEDAIFALKTGFRAKYIYDAALRFESGEITPEEIKKLPTEKADETLRQIKGIGPKVSACALLFGFEKYDVFPVDVWIKRVLSEHFPPGFDPASLGPYRGIAQQYLFYHGRYMS